MLLIAGGAGAQPIEAHDFLPFDPAQARIGQLLFYDKILSGNRNIACATCHHHDLNSTDRLSLGIGEGGAGLGPARAPGDIAKRIPRNAPGLWNLGHRSVSVLFHDGRVERDPGFPSGFASPAGRHLPDGLTSALAVQALFPMTAEFEMAGNPGENPVADAVAGAVWEGWPLLTARVAAIPAYADLFAAAFPEVARAEDITIVQIANALAAFIGTEWQSFDSPYDAFLQSGTPLPEAAERGRQLFFGAAGCAGCHSGPLFSDQSYHAMGLPGFGPGRIRKHDPIPRDVGRMGVTDDPDDAYRFRTLPLRNVALTAPYGHNGAYPTLRGMIRHMANPVGERMRWQPQLAHLPTVARLAEYDFVLMEDRLETARQLETVEVPRVPLNSAEVDDIEAFLHALTGASAAERPLGRPDTVPSGLPVD
nr:cytochrome c peroxidase [Salipiger pentaromativorans]